LRVLSKLKRVIRNKKGKIDAFIIQSCGDGVLHPHNQRPNRANELKT
jgi:hypothetical protein